MKSRYQKRLERNFQILKLHDKEKYTFEELATMFSLTASGVHYAYKQAKLNKHLTTTE